MILLAEIADSARKCGPETLRQQRPALTKSQWRCDMADKPIISVETLRQLLTYDPETGKLTWLPRPREMFCDDRAWKIWNTQHAGKTALNAKSHGYRHGPIFNKRVFAHRVAWALHYGHWPLGSIDHINGDQLDNRIPNLREVNHQGNARNSKRSVANASGVTGVGWYAPRGKWRARIRVDGRNITLGYFSDFGDAVAARKEAETRFEFHPNHGRHS